MLGLGISGAVLWALDRQLHSWRLHDIADQVSRLPLHTLIAACALMVFSFAGAMAMDAQALRYLGRVLSYRRIALASFIGSALGNSLGFALLSGGSVRYRLYSAAGSSAGDVGKIVTFNGVTYWSGTLSLAGTVLLLQWPQARMPLALSAVRARLLGIAALALVAAYLLWSALGDKPVNYGVGNGRHRHCRRRWARWRWRWSSEC